MTTIQEAFCGGEHMRSVSEWTPTIQPVLWEPRTPNPGVLRKRVPVASVHSVRNLGAVRGEVSGMRSRRERTKD